MKCRQSELTNHQWCLENDISPSAFNNWIYRLRQKGFTIPSNTKRQTISNNNAEFVKVAVIENDQYLSVVNEKKLPAVESVEEQNVLYLQEIVDQNTPTMNTTSHNENVAVSIDIAGMNIKYYNHTNLKLIETTLSLLGALHYGR